MLDIIIDTLLDAVKLLPFLFIAFLLIELLEHKIDNKKIINAGKLGPLIGSLLGIVPQCGFSVIATNFYITRVISIGTLISIYLSTSDEMLPIMLSEHANISIILKILLIKFICGLIFGFIIDLLISIKNKIINYNYHVCEDDHCDCEHGIIKSSLIHTFKTIAFILIITFLLNILFEYFGEKVIESIFMKKTLFGPFIGSLIGLIPNCGASVIITELYLKGVINLGTCIAGLLTGSGVALLVLFKSNKNIKENLFILTTIYLIGVLIGIFIELIGILL